MKLALYDDYQLGVINGDRIVNAMSAVEGMSFRRPQDMMEEVIINWGEMRPRIESAVEGQDGVALGSVRLRAPVPKPPKLICAAVNYLEFGQREPAVLDAFLKSPTAVIGSGDTCELPPAPASVFHHEPELAFVIGKTASKVEQDDALSYIFGYTNFLDMSARGLQGAVGNSFFLGKCWDTFAPMGPALVTADEIATRRTSKCGCGTTTSRATISPPAIWPTRYRNLSRKCRKSPRWSPATSSPPASTTSTSALSRTATCCAWKSRASARP